MRGTLRVLQTVSKTSSSQILAQYRQRLLTNPNAPFSQKELDLLLSTANDTGLTPAEIKHLYKYKHPTTLLSRGPRALTEFAYDDISSIAHDMVAQHREQRFYNRVAAWDLPQLVKYRNDYVPAANPAVMFRYTNYPGEETHPAASKVVMNVKTDQLGLNEKQLHKFILLCGPRYNPDTKIAKFAYNDFPESIQNKEYLVNILRKLIAQSKVGDMFEDIPFDSRPYKATLRRRAKKSGARSKLAFPESWKRPEDAPKPKYTLTNL